MNKKIVIGIAVAVVLLGAAVFFVSSKKSMNGAGNQASLTPDGVTSAQSISDLYKAGTPQQCTFNSSDATESTGTVLVANGKIRGDFSMKVDGADTTTHMIGDGKNTYVWTDDQGFKMAFDASTSNLAGASQGQVVDPSKKMNYNCKEWSPDETVFEVPSNVTFSEVGAPKVDTSVNGGTDTDMKISRCAACESAPADAQVQCKAALGC